MLPTPPTPVVALVVAFEGLEVPACVVALWLGVPPPDVPESEEPPLEAEFLVSPQLAVSSASVTR